MNINQVNQIILENIQTTSVCNNLLQENINQKKNIEKNKSKIEI